MRPEWCSVVMCLLCFVGAAAGADGQSRKPIATVRTAEAFAHVGRFHASGDEGAIGEGASFGGVLTVPIGRGLAIDFDVQTSRVSRSLGRPNTSYEIRRTLAIPSLLYRFGDETIHGHFGLGIGGEVDRSTYRQDVRSTGWVEIRPGVFELRQSETRTTASVRGAVVVFPLQRLGLRADVFVAGRNVGARVAVGYRFG
jgi:hypothetical protein